MCQLGTHEIAEGPGPVRACVDARKSKPGRGGQHVECAADRDPTLRGEHVAAAFWQIRKLEDQVDDHAAERDEPLDHRVRSARRRATSGSKSRPLTCRTLRTASGGSAATPVHAPTIAPAIAAMVSVSPPSAAASVHAAQVSDGCRLAMANAVGTDSADSTPVAKLPSRSASSNSFPNPKWLAAAIASGAACRESAPPAAAGPPVCPHTAAAC